MNWKEFLRPDWRKMVLIVIFNLIFFYFVGWSPCAIISRPSYCRTLETIIFIFQPTFIIGTKFGYGDLPLIFGFIISLFYQYLLSCPIVWIYDKVKKK